MAMDRLSEERLQQLKHYAKCGTNDATPPEIRQLVTDLEQARNNDHLIFFYDVVTDGFICGLSHPIEWAVNAYRTPGGTLDREYYSNCEKHLPRYLVDVFKLLEFREAKSADDVFQWCDSYYKNNEMFRGFFEFLRGEIDSYIEKQK